MIDMLAVKHLARAKRAKRDALLALDRATCEVLSTLPHDILNMSVDELRTLHAVLPTLIRQKIMEIRFNRENISRDTYDDDIAIAE